MANIILIIFAAYDLYAVTDAILSSFATEELKNVSRLCISHENVSTQQLENIFTAPAAYNSNNHCNT